MLIAVEGTHCAGKTTLATTLCARLLEDGHRAGLVAEVVRDNHAIIDLIHRGAPFTLDSQIQLAAHHLHTEATRLTGHDIVVTDRSALNVLAYLAAQDMTNGAPEDHALADAFAGFLNRYSSRYTLVLHCQDQYPIDAADPLRSGTASWQATVARSLDAVLAAAPCPVVPVPTGLATSERVAFAVHHLEAGGHLTP
jgi:hypothetical protein